MAESRFLRSLPADLLTTLEPDLERIELRRGEDLHTLAKETEHVYFPTSCLCSLVVTLESGSMVEASTVGNDGFVGVSTFLGQERSELNSMVQVPGEAFRMSTKAFHSHLADDRFRESVAAYAAGLLQTVAQSVACMAFHPVNERLARWLLMVRDGTERDEFALTQDFLAIMLGVHRPTVTIAVRQLESAGLITHRRGTIRITDVEALTSAACECYRPG